MKIAIMQPYFFPYLGYFQLIKAVDQFVFYDDVNFINRGWINRNRVLVGGNAAYITLSLEKASQNKKIHDIRVIGGEEKILKTLHYHYKKAPCFPEVFPLVENVLNNPDGEKMIAKVAAASVTEVCRYLGLTTKFEFSSEKYADTRDMGRAERLMEICKRNAAGDYINAPGGRELYSKAEFAREGIDLHFLAAKTKTYRQFGPGFIPNLSIIDVLMFNDKDRVRDMLDDYELE